MPDTAASTSNQRVTNAILGTKLDILTQDVRELKADVKEGLKEHHDRITTNREAIIKHSEQIRNRSWIIGIAQAISTGIGAVFGNR